MSKGFLSSINGSLYEKTVYNILHNCNILGNAFNTQEIKELGGSKSCNDIECNYNGIKNIGIEVKKYNTPDWMQCSLKYIEGRWKGTEKCKIPLKSKEMFDEILTKYNLYEGYIPPFINKNLTYKEWTNIKQQDKLWNDIYFDIPDDTIKKLYNLKGCQYIQISNYGLYHLGEDVCKFDVPEFNIEQHMRVRIKVHTRRNKQGYCNLSVTAACKPKNIKMLVKSPYSLDNIEALPKNLKYLL